MFRMSFRQTKICLAAEGIELSDINVQRRQFLKTSVGAAAVTIAPGMLLFDMAHGKSEAVSSKIRWGMLIDTAKCVDGCNDCVTACNKENGLAGGLSSGGLSPTGSQWIRKVELKDMTNKPSAYIVSGVTDQWQKISIPFEKFRRIANWNSLNELVVVFDDINSNPKKGSILIDQITFSKQ